MKLFTVLFYLKGFMRQMILQMVYIMANTLLSKKATAIYM